MYICVTHVDSKTKVPGFKRPMRNGPTFPEVKGLNIEWWDQSNWPMKHPDQYPKFYGTCDDDADISVDGVIETMTEERYLNLKQAEEFARLPTDCTPSQFRLALIKKDLYNNVISTIEIIEEPLKTAIKVDLEFTLSICRHSPLVSNLVKIMDWDDNVVTDIFVTASQISIEDFNNDNLVDS